VRTVPASFVPPPAIFAASARSTSDANPPRCSASLSNSSLLHVGSEFADKRAVLRVDAELFQMRDHIFHRRLSGGGSLCGFRKKLRPARQGQRLAV
jgi:hypothetical protein